MQAADKLSHVVFWLKRRRPRAEAPRLRPRVAATELARVDFTELVPDPLPFLGQAASLQLAFFESLAKAVATAPDLVAKEGLSVASGEALAKHHALIAELRRADADPAEYLAMFAAATDQFRQLTIGADWHELLLGIHLTSGMLDDFFLRLSAGLPGELARRVRGILGDRQGAPVLETLLTQAIANEPGLADRLALWGRSLVGDTLLVARKALEAAEPEARHGEDVEPVFTELIAEHTRRMDALGLTA
ncbi:ferritin-like domain-containing protein [Agromyces mediolanus]|nr:ferritin-like domain-containing protein [Agromyces mediolanus]